MSVNANVSFVRDQRYVGPGAAVGGAAVAIIDGRINFLIGAAGGGLFLCARASG